MLIQDLRYAIRGFIKRPGFAVIAILTLSLGIGATTAIFSVVQAVLLRPLEYPQADRLVKLIGFDKNEGVPGNLSPADFLDFQRDNTVFARMGANGWVGLVTITGGRARPNAWAACRSPKGSFHPAGSTGDRPVVSSRRGSSRRGPRRAHQRRFLAPPLRRRSSHRRVEHHRQRACRPR